MKFKTLVVGCTLLLSTGVAPAVTFSTVEVAGKRVTVCRVDVRKEQLQLFHRDEEGRPFRRFDRLASWLEGHNQQLVFAMNAGMYHDDFSAVGLFVSGGKQHTPLNTARGRGNFFLKPNGVFAVTPQDASVVESSAYPKLKNVLLATQSGPLLVFNGKIHRAFEADSDSRLIRNGVGVPSPGVALFAISEEPVNFYEFAVLFRDILRCPNALFLDGNISSLYSVHLKRNTLRAELGPIIGITDSTETTRKQTPR
jgi:uncharacterized protein YigE (DUF2233 family)